MKTMVCQYALVTGEFMTLLKNNNPSAVITCIGECMVELTAAQINDTDKNTSGENGRADEQLLKVNFAGDTLNTTIYMARLLKQATGHDLAIRYVTALGQDNFSSQMLDSWRSEGIDTRYVCTVAGKLPGLYTVNVDATGERSFHYWRSDSAARALFSAGLHQGQMENIATQSALLFLSGISVAILPDESRQQLVDLLATAKGKGALIAFDTNHRPALWPNSEEARQWYEQILALTDIALLTFEDEQLLFHDQSVEDTLKRLEHIPELIIKQGSDPCLVKANGNIESVTAQQVSKPVDTTGAGDSFNGAYLSQRILGATPVAACQAGHRLAAQVIMHPGGVIPKAAMPTL